MSCGLSWAGAVAIRPLPGPCLISTAKRSVVTEAGFQLGTGSTPACMTTRPARARMQVWANCRAYNAEGSDICRASKRLEKAVLAAWKEAGLPRRPGAAYLDADPPA